MNLSDQVLKESERVLYRLRELYQGYGYARYKVSKFEEYDLYAYNKSFLTSENILTFTDTNGKLMALKPDVTLSIVKNIEGDDPAMHKLCYNETVYRTSASWDGFREIMQTGLECIGKIDLCAIGEVVMLAQKSLALIGEDYILDISHIGFLTGLLEEAGLDAAETSEILSYVGNKNLPAVTAFCKAKKLDAEIADAIVMLTDLYEPLDVALERIKPMVRGEKMREAYAQLSGVMEMIDACGDTERLYLDFSIMNDMSYYNGIIFRGFVNGIADGVLSGGRYDSLLSKMGKRQGALGFAVYLDLLERLGTPSVHYDADIALLYGDDDGVADVMKMANELRASGASVMTLKEGSTGALRFRKMCRMSKGGLEILEAND